MLHLGCTGIAELHVQAEVLTGRAPPQCHGGDPSMHVCRWIYKKPYGAELHPIERGRPPIKLPDGCVAA